MRGVTMAKEFKTIEELVELLASRNVRTDDDTARALRRDGYYAIVNGYKDTFLDREAMRSSDDDVYKDGTTFRQIYDLFPFDRDMRNAVFPYLTMAESVMKNAVVYAFCERNPKVDAYLDRSSYTSARDMLVPEGFKGNKAAEHGRNMSDLMRRLNGKLRPSEHMRPFIRHYPESYGAVPLWVLQNDLTFGNVSHFYQLQKRGVQNGACRVVAEVAGHGRRIGARSLLRAFAVLSGFRNICAHEDRFYCADVKGAHVDGMLGALDLVLPRDERDRMFADLNLVAESYGGRVDPRALNSMYSDPSKIPEGFR